MKKLVIYFLALSFLLPVLSGCEDFLTLPGQTLIDESTYPLKPADVDELLTGTYAALIRGMYEFRNGETHYMFLSELLSDDCTGGGGRNDINPQATNHLLVTERNYFDYFWQWNYAGIARALTVMDALENNFAPGDEIRTIKEAEARFLRALFYFDLVRTLENVPILEAIPSSVAEATEVPDQVHPDEIYKLLATDLLFAYQNLPNTPFSTPANGKATKWAAASYIARAFLFYTGFYNKPDLPRDGGSITKQEVIAMLEDVINNSNHELVPDFRALWPYTNKLTKPDYPYVANENVTWVEDGFNPEHVFVIKCAPDVAWNWGSMSNIYCMSYGPRGSTTMRDIRSIFPFGRGWGFGPVSTRLWDEWENDEPDDMRRQATIWRWDLEAMDPITLEPDPSKYEWGCENQVEETGLWRKKIAPYRAWGKLGVSRLENNSTANLWNVWESDPAAWNMTRDNWEMGSGSDIILFRYADVLLMHSELTDGASLAKYGMSGMNKVRDRAHLPQKAYTLEALQKERRYELATEGHRWSDIRRWHIAEQVLNRMYGEPMRNGGVEVVQKIQGSAGDIASRYRATNGGFMMIPQTQIDLSNGKYKQNAGWTDDINYMFYTWQ